MRTPPLITHPTCRVQGVAAGKNGRHLLTEKMPLERRTNVKNQLAQTLPWETPE